MATTIYPTVPVAQPEAEAWPVDNDPISIQADEMFARQLDTGFAGEIRNLLCDPEAGLAGKDPEDALGGVAEAMPMLGELKDRYLAQAIGPRQKAILEPLIDTRLDRASGEFGRIAQRATSVLDDRRVAERLADLQQDAILAWHDPAQLRVLGQATVGELRYQGERRGWDETQTNTTVRQGLSDLYAGAVEQAIGQDPDGAATLYEHARDVIQPDRQTVVERKMERAREERRVSEVVGNLADTSDDPTRRPDLDDYQVRAAELTPPDASPEVRDQVNRMVRIEHAHAERAWQAARGRAAVVALDWLGKNPAARLLAMPAELRDGLSPEQTERLDQAAINGGRVLTDHELYDALDGQAVHESDAFAAIDLTQHRLSLGDHDYQRLVGFQKAVVEGKSDAVFERHGLSRTFLDEGLHKANFDSDGPEARTAHRQLDRVLGAFETIEGKTPTMADIRGLVGDVLLPLTPLAGQDNGADVAGDGSEGDIQVARAPDNKPVNQKPPAAKPAGGGRKQQLPEKTGEQITQETERRREKALREVARKEIWDQVIRQPLPEKLAPTAQKLLPDDWEGTVKRISPDYLKWTKAAAEKNGIPPELLARLFYKESNYNPNPQSNRGAKGLAQLTPIAIKHLKLNPATFDYFDAEASINAGAALLGGYYREFKDWPKAVAAYNAGNAAVLNWLGGNGKDGDLKPETRTMLMYVFRGQPKAFDKPR